MMQEMLRELSGVFASLKAGAVDSAVSAIHSHCRIFVYAAGRSGLMLKAFAMRLAQMGMTVYVVGETVTPAIGQGDLLILASASGSTHSTCHYARIAKDAGADVFVITGKEASPLAEIAQADVILPAASKNDAGNSRQVMGSLFEQALLLFCDGVVANCPMDAADMRARHANLE